MGGTFTPESYVNCYENTFTEQLSVNIPSPFTHDSEEEAMKDGDFAYRFVSDGENVLIAIYERESWEPAIDKKGRKCINVWTEGKAFCYYTYEEFLRLGGKLYEWPEQQPMWKEEDFKVDVSFNDLFPSLTRESKPVYIDNEAYIIIKED